uniref:Reverse transcriptase domain-containing protein n=1 Tax=Latimeria chalumnae TaxID=7897 RepID=H3AD39_LATCH
IKDVSGTHLLVEPEEVDERWREYFCELLNMDNGEETSDTDLESSDTDLEFSDTDLQVEEEVISATKAMRNGKAAGIDGIPVEVFKNGGLAMMSWIQRVFQVVWDMGRMPKEWGKAIICPIFKKGDRLKCENYRALSLLPHICKIYERILETRLHTTVEEKLDQYQHGFWPGRGTINLVFALRMIVERSWEWNVPQYMAFLDLEKAFDRVPRKKLWEVLEDPPPKFLRAVKGMCSVYESMVQSQHRNEKWFTVRSDDVAIVERSAEDLQNTVEKGNTAFKEYGMKLSTPKSEIMVIRKDQEQGSVIVDDGTKLKQVSQCKYLGAQINVNGKIEEEITARIKKFSNNVASLYPLLKDRRVPKGTKILIYTTLIYGVTLRDKLRNEHIREQLGVESVLDIIERTQLRWFGHVKNGPSSTGSKVSGKRSRGHPRKRWLENVEQGIRKRGLSMAVVEERKMYEDRTVWGGFIHLTG